MLEKETNETGRHSKIIIGPQSSDDEADDEEEQSAQVRSTLIIGSRCFWVRTFCVNDSLPNKVCCWSQGLFIAHY